VASMTSRSCIDSTTQNDTVQQGRDFSAATSCANQDVRPENETSVVQNDFISVGRVIIGRYRIAHRLCRTQSCSIWLCYDQLDIERRWKTIKFVVSEASALDSRRAVIARLWQDIPNTSKEDRRRQDNICVPAETFWVDGLYKRTLCIVAEVLGPQISNISRSDPELIRSVCLQIVDGLQVLHNHGICHGHLTPSTIHFQVSRAINNITLVEMEKLLGLPVNHLVMEAEMQESYRWPTSLGHLVLNDKISIADLDLAFYISGPPKVIEIPLQFAAPELLLHRKLEYGIDTWALACVVAEVRTGHCLINLECDNVFDIIAAYENSLGPLEEPCRSAWIMQSSQCELLDDLQAQRDSGDMEMATNSTKCAVSGTPVDCLRTYKSNKGQPLQSSPSLHIQATLALDIVSKCTILDNHERIGTEQTVRYKLSRAEALILADLLRRILRYDPCKRQTVSEIVDHSWFRSEFRRSSEILPQHIIPNELEPTEDHVSPCPELGGLQNRCQLRGCSIVGERKAVETLPHSPHRRNWNINPRTIVFITGLTVATLFWMSLIFANTKPATGMLAEHIVRSFSRFDFDGEKLT
jgi:serine/threonine-protein kinase SRPK3